MNPDNIYSIIRRQAAYLLPALLFTACDSNVAWTGTADVDREGWNAGNPVIFNLDPVAYESDTDHDRFAEMTSKAVGDTVARLKGNFNAIISLRYTDGCNASAIDVVVERASLDSEISTDTVSFILFDSDGLSAGKGRFGINEVSARLRRPVTVSEGTLLTLYPVDYDISPAGIMSATLILNK